MANDAQSGNSCRSPERYRVNAGGFAKLAAFEMPLSTLVRTVRIRTPVWLVQRYLLFFAQED